MQEGAIVANRACLACLPACFKHLSCFDPKLSCRTVRNAWLSGACMSAALVLLCSSQSHSPDLRVCCDVWWLSSLGLQHKHCLVLSRRVTSGAPAPLLRVLQQKCGVTAASGLRRLPCSGVGFLRLGSTAAWALWRCMHHVMYCAATLCDESHLRFYAQHIAHCVVVVAVRLRHLHCHVPCSSA